RSCVAAADASRGRPSLLLATRHEDVANSPDSLDVARLGRIGFEQTAQARDLHIDGAFQRIPFTTAGQLHELVAGQGHPWMVHQRLEYGELTGCQHMHFIAALELAGGQAEYEVAEGHFVVIG